MKTIIPKLKFNSLVAPGKYLIISVLVNLALVSSVISQNSYSPKNTIKRKVTMVTICSATDLVNCPIVGKNINTKYLDEYDQIENFSEVEPPVTYITNYVPKMDIFAMSKIDGEYLKKYDKIEKFPEFEYQETYASNYAPKVNTYIKTKINREYLKKYDKIEKFPEFEYQETYASNYAPKINTYIKTKINREYLKTYDRIEKFPDYECEITYTDSSDSNLNKVTVLK